VNREQLLGRIERHWGAFNDACAGLPDAVIEAPRAVGDWSVKDLIAHVATWEGEALIGLPIIMMGKRPPRYGGVDNFNAREYDRICQLNLTQARDARQASHRRLLDFLANVPETWFATETRFRHRLRLDTWAHYPEHTQAILAWRKTKGL
jgi:DinB superfamily